MIVVDTREMSQHPDIPTLLQTPCSAQLLDAADYMFLDRNKSLVGIERCELGNLLQKIRDGELEDQLARCANQYETVVLVTEGVFDHFGGLICHYRTGDRNRGIYYRTRVEAHFTYAEMEATKIRLSELGIEVFWTPGFEFTMNWLDIFYKQRTKPEEAHSMFKKSRQIRIPIKYSTNPAVPMLMALCPRLPERVAIRLVDKYRSIWNILNTDSDELIEVPGFGKGLVRKLFESVGRV